MYSVLDVARWAGGSVSDRPALRGCSTAGPGFSRKPFSPFLLDADQVEFERPGVHCIPRTGHSSS